MFVVIVFGMTHSTIRDITFSDLLFTIFLLNTYFSKLLSFVPAWLKTSYYLYVFASGMDFLNLKLSVLAVPVVNSQVLSKSVASSNAGFFLWLYAFDSSYELWSGHH